MTATYLGSFTVGAAVPGITAEMNLLGGALSALRDACQSALLAFTVSASLCSNQSSGCLVAKAAIRVPAVASPEASLNAAINFADSFSASIMDPAAYLQGLLSGLAAIQSSLAVALPVVAVDTQLQAAIEQQVTFGSAVAAIDLELSLLDAISLSLQGAADLLAEAKIELQLAIDIANLALTRWLDFQASLSATGAHCLMVETTTANVGAELQAAIDTIGLGVGVSVRLPVVLVEASNTSASSAVDATFRVS